MKPPRLCLAVIAALCSAACQTIPPARATTGQIEHIVLIWLKQAGDMAVKQTVAAAALTFPSQIDGIVAMSIGEAEPSDRPSDDDSFDLALVMRFASKSALDAYLVHPVHVHAVEQVLAPNLAKLVVYDSRVW